MLLTSARPELIQQVREARSATDRLFEIIRPDSWYERPISERHRLIFYLGHLEAFDWNLIAGKTLGERPFHPAFDKLFEFGIDPPEGSLPSDQPLDWPSVDEVRDYNRQVREKLDGWMDHVPEQLVHVALEHRLMHAETLAYLLHGLDYAHNHPQSSAAFPLGAPMSPAMIDVPSGIATLGQSPDAFGWDNEFARHQVHVPAFSIARYKVTNGEYLEFVRAGAAAPHFWSKRGEAWQWRGMFEEIPLPLDWPVYVTQAEAAAYAQWKGLQLPTEEQFHRAAFGSPAGRERLYPWGDSAPDETRGNFDFVRWEPAPVSAYPLGDSAFGVAQLVGNGWEWTSTVFAPFRGFETFPFYPGYSSNFFDGNHYVMKGASPRTAACLLRRSFRNWFRSRYPYVYATFRLSGN
ncbi:MAG TPA: SUMF1/EgtB/PvdO family nonheme iron enzyme [Bryobacteraceae bacterium]|nr:SUMF1/EgtB/PvdO family nonheme iron enzyme [Bryobacteraceae bacterium]